MVIIRQIFVHHIFWHFFLLTSCISKNLSEEVSVKLSKQKKRKFKPITGGKSFVLTDKGEQNIHRNRKINLETSH